MIADHHGLIALLLPEF